MFDPHDPMADFDRAVYPIRAQARLSLWSSLVKCGRVMRQVDVFNAKVRAEGHEELVVHMRPKADEPFA